MSSALLDAERVHAACCLAYVEHREMCKSKSVDDDYGPESGLYRLDFLSALAEAAIASGQTTVSVSLDDYILLHSCFARVKPPRAKGAKSVSAW